MIYWTYEQDLIVLDDSLTDKEKRKLLPYKSISERRNHLENLRITKEKLIKEKQQLIDIYPDYTMAQIQVHLQKSTHYVRTRIWDLRELGLLREEKILTNKELAYIELYASKKKASRLAEELQLPIHLVKMAVSEQYRKGAIKDKPKKTDSMPKKIMLHESNNPPNSINKREIKQKKYKNNGLYEVIKTSRNKGDLGDFKGILIYQDEDFILLKHNEHGYKESFNKVDFETGEYAIKEVIK